MSLPQLVACDHCGYESEEQTERLGDVGAEGAWTCPACSICNTTWHREGGYVTVLGYERDLEVGFL